MTSTEETSFLCETSCAPERLFVALPLLQSACDFKKCCKAYKKKGKHCKKCPKKD